jgi:hypothetical protein
VDDLREHPVVADYRSTVAADSERMTVAPRTFAASTEPRVEEGRTACMLGAQFAEHVNQFPLIHRVTDDQAVTRDNGESMSILVCQGAVSQVLQIRLNERGNVGQHTHVSVSNHVE